MADKSVAPGEGGSTGRQPQSGTSSRQQSPRQPTAAMSLGSVNSMADAEMAAPPGSTHHSATSSPRSATSGSKPPAALALKKEHFRAATPASDVATPSMLTTRMSASPRPAGGTSLTFRGRAQTPSASQSMRSYRDEHVPAAGDTRPLSTLIVTVLLVLQLWGALFFFVVGGGPVAGPRGRRGCRRVCWQPTGCCAGSRADHPRGRECARSHDVG